MKTEDKMTDKEINQIMLDILFEINRAITIQKAYKTLIGSEGITNPDKSTK